MSVLGGDPFNSLVHLHVQALVALSGWAQGPSVLLNFSGANLVLRIPQS